MGATTAPQSLKDARHYMLSTFDAHPGRAVNADLDPEEVGIVGDPAHMTSGGAHLGRADLARIGRASTDYTVRESPRDRASLTNDAAAVDIGWFEATLPNGTRVDLRHFSVWCVGQCQAGAPDTADIREIIYSPDGRTVRRWDRLGKRSTGDSSHLSHTHFTEFRDAGKAGRRLLLALFQRYVATFSGALAAKGPSKMLVIGKDATGQLWLCSGVLRTRLDPARVPDVKWLAKNGAIDPLWRDGEVWNGVNDAFGRDVESLVNTDALADKVAARLKQGSV